MSDLEDAARYAQQQGVVIVAAAGNESDDLGHPTTDEISPDWPPESAVAREVRNNCRVTPAEIPGSSRCRPWGRPRWRATRTWARPST